MKNGEATKGEKAATLGKVKGGENITKTEKIHIYNEKGCESVVDVGEKSAKTMVQR